MRLDEEKVTVNFNHVSYLVFELDRALLQEFYKSFPIKIWGKYPIKKFKPQPDEKKEPEFDIIHKEEMVGFAIISLESVRIEVDRIEFNMKYPIFEYGTDSLHYYNVFWPHPEEQKRIEQEKESVEKERKDKYTKKPTEEEEGAKKDGKGIKKPDPKKKKPAPGKKGQEEEIKIDIPDWPVNSRSVIAYQADEIARDGTDNYPTKESRFLVAGQSLLSVGIKIF